MGRYSKSELNNFSKSQLIDMMPAMQDQMSSMNDNLEKLIEQIRIATQNRYGRRVERLDEISGQLSLFNEAEAYASDDVEEDVTITVRKKKQPGNRNEDFKDLPHEKHDHKLLDEQLDEFFGKDSWRRMKPEQFIRVRCQSATYTVEDHNVDVAVGTCGYHQDEFLRGDRSKDLLRNSVVTPSLMAAIWNSKYVNA